MKTSVRWILIIFACFVIPALLIEGVFHYFHIESIDDLGVIKVLTYLVGFVLTTNLALVLEWKQERQRNLDEISTHISNLISSEVHKSISDRITTGYIGSGNSPAFAESLKVSFEDIINSFKNRSLDLIEACQPILKTEISRVSRRINDLLGSGTKIDISEHLKINRLLCEKYDTYLQIQRNAFDVPNEWTEDWMKFIDEVSQTSISKTYIVLLSARELLLNENKINSMSDYLVKRHFRFGICNFDAVIDSTGGGSISGVIEIFGEKIVKVSELTSQRYKGGISLDMYINTTDKRKDVMEFAQLVETLTSYR